jgi:putative nucleotidyltransferase-like protein
VARRICDESRYPAPLLTVAGYGLGGASRTFPAGPLDDATWAELLSAARHHRVTGELLAAVGDGCLQATDPQVRQARATHRSALLRVLSLERELVALVDLLAGSDIQTRVLKGSAFAHLDYSNPSLRSFIDIDLLVRPDDFDSAVRLLTAAGFVRTLAEPRPGFDRRFDKGTTLRSPAGYELDLHRTFVLGPWGVRVDVDSLWDEGEEFAIGTRTIRGLSRPNRFLQACYHAALGDWPLRLGSMRDVAEMLPAVEPDAETIVRRVAEWGVDAVVAAAVSDTHRLLGLASTGELLGWARGFVPSRRDEAWLALHTHEDKTFAAQALATLRALPLRDRAAYLHALLLPDVRYTAGRHRSAVARYQFALREVRRGRGVRQ